MDSYEVKFIRVPTGRTHNVIGQGVQPILDEATGEPETEFRLVAIVDDHYVNLGEFTAGYVAHLVGSHVTAIDASSDEPAADTSSAEQPQPAAAEQPATPPAGEGTAGEGAAAQPPPQPAG